MALAACSNCGHYYVTEGEVRERTRCPYCQGQTRPADAGEAIRYLQPLLHALHDTAKRWTRALATPSEPGGRRSSAVWTSAEDGERYRELTRQILATSVRRAGAQSLTQVEVEDLAAYLEWFELAREAAPSLRPFIAKSSPYALRDFSYRQMTQDFAWLRAQLTQVKDGPAAA